MTKTTVKTAVMPSLSVYRFALLSALALALATGLMTEAYAIATPMGAVMCDIVYMIYGNLGRGLATLAIIIVGVGATLGKVSWGLAITVAIGISVIANAGQIMFMLTGATGC